ncbi:MAG TPA: ATP-binding protein [Solirubrobacteraceae bacterium]|jgi:two-component system OmpR family sensor kinase|nr:ATP-binding protein [Solirubrobacteraceae bacterium]
MPPERRPSPPDGAGGPQNTGGRGGRPGGPVGLEDTRGRGARPGGPAQGGSKAARVRPLATTSLRWRLAAWVALVVVVSTGIAFLAVYRGTGTQLRRQIDGEMVGDADELAHALSASGARTPAAALAGARAYVRSQPYNASSTVLFALVPGGGVATNTPELFGSHAPDDDESVATQEQENRIGRRLLTPHAGFATLQLPDVGRMRLLERRVRLTAAPHTGAGVPVTVGVGEPLASVASAQHGVAKAFILAGAIALAGALLGALLIGTRFSRPLRRMAAVAAQVDAGDLHPRIHDVEREGSEVRVLADAFNHMLDRLTEAFAGQRAFIADASHELRTPLTVIRGQLEVLAAQRNPSGEEVRRVERLLQAEIARVTRLVDDLLLLAKAEQSEFLRPRAIDLPSFVRELWESATLLVETGMLVAMGTRAEGGGPPASVEGGRLPASVPRCYQLGEIPAGTLIADPDRIAQALRNLIVNALEHTAERDGLVRLRGERIDGGRVRLIVEDDGPGIQPDQRERVFDRFHRTDAARDRASGGAGLGLAIVRAIAEAHGGRASARESDAGGARLELELPRFSADTPRRSRDRPGSDSVRRDVPFLRAT